MVPLDLEPLRLESGCKAGAVLGSGCLGLDAGTKVLECWSLGSRSLPRVPLVPALDPLARGP